MNPFLMASMAAFIRWALTILAARGLATEGEQRQLAEALVLVFTLTWSIWQKKRAVAR